MTTNTKNNVSTKTSSLPPTNITKLNELIRLLINHAADNHSYRTFLSEIQKLLTPSSSNSLPIYSSPFSHFQLLESISTIKIVLTLPISQPSSELYHHSLGYYLLLLSLHTHKLFVEQILKDVHKLKKHIEYWKHNQKTPISSLIHQITTTYFFDKETDDILASEKLKYLKNYEFKWMNSIGKLCYSISTLNNYLSSTSTKNEFIKALDTVEVYTNYLYFLIFDGTLLTLNYQSTKKIIDLINCYEHILLSLPEFHQQLSIKTRLYHQPTHLKRYWAYYTFGTLTSLYLIYKLYSKQKEIINQFYSTFDSFKFFMSEHLFIPLKAIYESTFHSKSSQAIFENTQKNYQNSKIILEQMIEQYGIEHSKQLSHIEHVDIDQFLTTLHERAVNEDMNVVMKYYQYELDQPIRSALFGDLIKGILIQVQKVKVDGESLAIQIDQLMKQNQINFSLLATIPAFLLITFLTITTKNTIVNRVIKRRKFDYTIILKQIIRKLRHIEQLLIFNTELSTKNLQQPLSTTMNYNNNLINIDEEDLNNSTAIDQSIIIVDNTTTNDVFQMNNLTFGQLLCLIYELKFYTVQLRSTRLLSNEINEDVNLLTNTTLTIKQKLLLIKQIFHSYSFLSK
ncbi:unnamed protein product [Didymodactylos carnosus]|uniref:Nuclear control of ATPase protein 2 n=1 Tax=Didymodactylos carnosus TaxID=1234261 RepID=A0A814GX85_9BILA|nr:unnamed protein product [Didymodactylos carnosus]CAF3774139.1 unnamed protein product [Didymodactylos carnosus]